MQFKGVTLKYGYPIGVSIGVSLKEHIPELIFAVKVRRNYQNVPKTTNFAE